MIGVFVNHLWTQGFTRLDFSNYPFYLSTVWMRLSTMVVYTGKKEEKSQSETKKEFSYASN